MTIRTFFKTKNILCILNIEIILINWDRLPECIFSKITRVIYPKNRSNQTRDYWLITPNHKHFVLKVTSFNSGQLQNNTVNSAMSISINHVIKIEVSMTCVNWVITRKLLFSGEGMNLWWEEINILWVESTGGSLFGGGEGVGDKQIFG